MRCTLKNTLAIFYRYYAAMRLIKVHVFLRRNFGKTRTLRHPTFEVSVTYYRNTFCCCCVRYRVIKKALQTSVCRAFFMTKKNNRMTTRRVYSAFCKVDAAKSHHKVLKNWTVFCPPYKSKIRRSQRRDTGILLKRQFSIYTRVEWIFHRISMDFSSNFY